MPRTIAVCAVLTLFTTSASAADGNRLAYLDGPLDPYYPHRDFPKLMTPQWVGEEGVEAVVTLAIDDMRETAKYEAFLRPILSRLKQIDGRAPVSIMTCRVDPADPQLQTWLKEGLSIEVHTYDHPCPCLQDGGLVKAKETYDKCVDLMNQIPNNKPVAFRMPCCDSKNTPSPRFWAEAFNKTTEKGNFLQIDSSVFNIITNKDKELPKEITELPDGSERFRRYVPFANFVNTIEDYPYPYIIGGMCWEFPCVVPSDWSAQHVQKPNNPDTVRDWNLALDAIVKKQGTFNLVFHPHGWIKAEQIIELIDHAVAKHGKKVKFLTFKECAERLERNLLERKLRSGVHREGVQLLDQNNDGLLDVMFFNWLPSESLITRDWDKAKRRWTDKRVERGHNGHASVSSGGLLRDVDGDGKVEGIIPEKVENGMPKGFMLTSAGVEIGGPKGTSLFHADWNDAGLRLVDVNADGKLDCLFSNHERYSLHLFKDMQDGWSLKVFDVVRGKEDGTAPVIPPFVRGDGTNNGAWFHSGALWLQNEDTWRLPDNVFNLTFAEMLGKKEPGAGGQEPKRAASPADKAILDKPAVPSAVQSVLRSASQFVSNQLSGPRFDELEMTKPRSPEESLKAMHVRPGMKIELVAAEPLVADPVAFDWGSDGRLWVVEMRDYPNGIHWNKEGDEIGKPGGRVKVLTDTDGDGRYDRASTFLDEIPFPTGVKVWRNGILVTAAPEIFYAEDTNGDDVADERKVLYRGFGEGNQQHRVNGLRWGLDNWLHVGNGDSGGVIKSLTTNKEVNVGGRDLRIRPDTGDIDATSGNTQFGRERDDWGNWFGGNNSNPMWHYTLDDFYLRRNPHLSPPPVKKQVSVAPGAAPVFPKSQTLARFNDFSMANRFTSACSPIIYRDELLGPGYYGNSFVCEPVHNLVHREIVEPQGTTFTSRRPADEQQSEFLASDDSWFRPSMCRTGPDGALWIADMYRFVIEHPKWIPEAAQKKLDLRAGDDKGRIYRVYPEGQRPRPIARLDKLDTAGLVAALDSPNGPQRDLAQQMLIWRDDKAAVEPLLKLAAGASRPQVRLHTLCTLDGLNAVTDDLLIRALGDAHAGVRRHAIRLAESRLATSPSLEKTLLKLQSDRDPQVQIQLAYSLASCRDAAEPLAALLIKHQSDPYITAAALSSLNKPNIALVLPELLKATDESPRTALLERLLAMAAAMGEDAAVSKALARIIAPQPSGDAAWQFTALASVMPALARRSVKLDALLDQESRDRLPTFLKVARKSAVSNTNPSFAASAITLLARGLDDSDEADVQLLASLLAPQKAPEIRSAAVTALARTGRREAPALLLAGWPGHSPSLRSQILDALATREDWSLALLSAVEGGQIASSQFDARRRQQFVTARSRTVRDKAEKVLSGAIDPNRQKLVEKYSAAAATTGDHTRGKLVFAKRCANCHRLEGAGHSLGPDLAALAARPADYLLTQILDPNRAVEDRYLEYVVLTADGRQLTGMLAEETGASLTLAAPEGKQSVVARSDIDQIKSSGKSLMPEGVEKDVSPAEMADLLAYLKTSTPPPKNLPGNQPEVVRPFVSDGSLRLLATNARIYGPTLVLEDKYRNLGWWNSQEDHAAWSFDVPAGDEGAYRVTIDYSCPDSAAGNTVIVEVGGQSLSAKVTSTGSWDDFRGLSLGTVTLPSGTSDLLVHSAGPIKSALFDLRAVRLVPAK